MAGPLPVTGRIEQSFLRRVTPLPEVTQRLLLLAAAEPVGDPALLWRAAGNLGLSADAAAPAEADGLLTVGARVTFRHPLVRSAVYQAAPAGDRRRAHRALAEATDPGTDPDRRAWHRAQAAAGPDEDVAAELERSAGRAQARGGFAAAAAFLERSAALTPDPGRRAQRALAAAQAKFQAGAFDAALELLATAESGSLDEFQRALADLLRGQIAFASRRDSDAPPLLLKAATSLELLDARLARETYLEALSASLFAGRLALGGGAREVAEAARAAPAAAGARARVRSAAGWPGAGDHGGLPGRGADAQASGERLPQRRCLQRGGTALAVAGLPERRAVVGLRELGPAVRPPGRARPRCRRAHCAAFRRHHPRGGASVGWGVRRGRLAGGGGGVGHRGDGQQPRAHRGRSARRLQGPGSRGC